MILMTKNGAYMNCYNVKEVAVAKTKGWELAPIPAPVKKTRKKRVKK